MLSSPLDASVGKRLSFGGIICTVRYVGKVEGQGDKVWLGVEWDDELRGKHDGTYKGKKYFRCLSPSPNAASFIQSKARKPDPELSFLEGVRQKYTSEVTLDPNPVSSAQIEISGKVVEEVGFDKIRQQLSQLDTLKIIILTGQRISIASKLDEDAISDVCPIIELIDLTSNLISLFSEVVSICQTLPRLRTLKLNENRFSDLASTLQQQPNGVSLVPPKLPPCNEEAKAYRRALAHITDLEMQKVLLNWMDLQQTMSYFSSLKTFDGSRNHLTTISPNVMSFDSLRSLVLDHNDFTSLSSIMLLSSIPHLEVLRLKANKIASIYGEAKRLTFVSSFPQSLRYVDLSANLVADWDFVDSLSIVFPRLQELRFSGNPVYGATSMSSGMNTAAEDSFMLTVAMLGGLTSLNFSKISSAERANAEMFYLSRIGKQISAQPEDQEQIIISKHRRYHELCQIHGAPTIVRQQSGYVNPNFLEARLLKCSFYLRPNSLPAQLEILRIVREIPKSFDIYRVKGIVGSILKIQPLRVRLIWETGEWDPVAGYEEDGMDIDGDGDDENETDAEANIGHEGGRMISREVELEDGTRPLGNWVDGMEATIRVEVIAEITPNRLYSVASFMSEGDR